MTQYAPRIDVLIRLASDLWRKGQIADAASVYLAVAPLAREKRLWGLEAAALHVAFELEELAGKA